LLQELQVGLPAGFPLPILVVQHLAKRYAAHPVGAPAPNCRMRVKPAEHREPVPSGTIYAAPDDYGLWPRPPGSVVVECSHPLGDS
jgi:two-component system, chemotaxis family, protein-glutamate methylesterase/glutaminase